ncbi:glycosyl hydrolase [Kockovaella imperatae]|uniref:Glycosyl hydrolase n=1 Tax=Kockovaella imperatae TaxID=4999 RepID=A0A1Y1UHK6_9TREE|nr:glycosyl hydrolase [Kockovaella imperatae]ORX37512.1 glycosyl hydrolase [Kockovaella imperatae]
MSSYRNPILPGFNPDPTILFHDGSYFIITSSFEYFPGLPVYESTDLVSWRLIGHVLTRPSQLHLRACEPSGGIFAPTLRYNQNDGLFYVTVCALHRMRAAVQGDSQPSPRGFYVTTKDLRGGQWSDPVYYDQLGIDQDLCFGSDGKTYLSVARSYPSDSARFNLGVFTTEIDLITGRSLRPAEFVRQSSTEVPIAEGPHLIEKDDYWYLFVAEGGTEMMHQEWVYRSQSGPYGPWEVGPAKDASGQGINPLVFNDTHREIRQTGHMDITRGGDGRWWAVFLGVRPQWETYGDCVESQLGRETFLAPLEWNEEGWPVVNSGQPISIKGLSSAQLPLAPPDYAKRFQFSPETDIFLDGWYQMRTPQCKFYSLTDRPGSIAIHGNGYTLENDESPAILLTKQLSFKAVFELDLDFAPENAGEEAGVAIWYSKWNSGRIGVVGVKSTNGQMGRELRIQLPDVKEVAPKIIKTPLLSTKDPIHLRIVAEPTRYHFEVAESGSTLKRVATMFSKGLTKTVPIPWLFVGTHFAIYCQGQGDQRCFAPAFFSNIEMRGSHD